MIDSVNEEWDDGDEGEEDVNRQQPKFVPGAVIGWKPEAEDKAVLVRILSTGF